MNQPQSLACPNCGSAMDVRMVGSRHKEGHCPVCDTRVDLSHTIPSYQGPQAVNVQIPVASQQNSGSSAAGIIVAIAAALVILVGGVAAFFVQTESSSSTTNANIAEPIISNSSGNLGNSAPSYVELSNSRPVELDQHLTSLACSPDGSLLAVGGDDTYVAILDAETLEVLSTFEGVYAGNPAEPNVMSLAFSPDGTTLAVGGWGGALEFWDVESQQRMRVVDDRRLGSVNDITFTSDGSRVILVTSSRNILVVNVPGGDIVLEIQLGVAPDSLALVNDESQVVVALGTQEQIAAFDLASGDRVRSISLDEQIHTVAAVPSGDQVAALGSDAVLFYDTSTWEVTKTLIPDILTFGTEALTFSRDGKYLAVGNFFRTGVIWEIESGAELVHFEDLERSDVLAFNPANTQLLTLGGTYSTISGVGNGNLIRVWAVSSALEIGEAEPQDTESIDSGAD